MNLVVRKNLFNLTSFFNLSNENAPTESDKTICWPVALWSCATEATVRSTLSFSLPHFAPRISTCLGSLQLCSSDTLRACLICTPFAVRARGRSVAERSIRVGRLARRSISRLTIQLEPEQGRQRADPSSRAEVNSRRYERWCLDCEPSYQRYCESRP